MNTETSDSSREDNFIQKLHFIIAPEVGKCSSSYFPIFKGETCLELLFASGKREWFCAESFTFKWWVLNHTNLSVEQAKRGLCNHGLLATCEKCCEIAPNFKENGLIAERKLWDDCGNYCRMTLYHSGGDQFELYIHPFNDATPVRFVGTLGQCIPRGESWISHKKEEGFKEQLPGYEPIPKN